MERELVQTMERPTVVYDVPRCERQTTPTHYTTGAVRDEREFRMNLGGCRK